LVNTTPDSGTSSRHEEMGNRRPVIDGSAAR
jgi:hypothetical protein